MERKPSPDPLKCPRCDSCNTKFCYYNNYSLAQPRHFCKACKRYWTRGGTLRNVPVGGGCRKNKRLRRAPPPPPNGGDCVQQPDSDLTTPLIYNSNNTLLELNFPFSGFNTTRVSSKAVGFDQIDGLGVRLSSGLMVGENYENGFKQIQDAITNTTSTSPFLSNNDPILFGSSNFGTMSSLLASSLQQQRFVSSVSNDDFSGLMPYEDMQILGGNGVINIGKEVKLDGENGFGLNPNQIGQTNPTDHSSLLWTTSGGGGANWFDPSNLGSSVPSLI